MTGAGSSSLLWRMVSPLPVSAMNLGGASKLDQNIFFIRLMVLDNQPQLNVQTKLVEPLVEGGAQIQQVLNIECLTDFSEAPLLSIKFR